MKYYIIAGEASGDLHASNLMKELLKIDSSIDFHFWGGDLMQAVANKKHYKHINLKQKNEKGFMQNFY